MDNMYVVCSWESSFTWTSVCPKIKTQMYPAVKKGTMLFAYAFFIIVLVSSTW